MASSLLPPPPPGSDPSAAIASGVEFGGGFSADESGSRIVNASILPLAGSVLSNLISAGLLAAVLFAPRDVEFIHNNLWFVAGYVLTPVVTTLMLGWDATSQRRGIKNPWFNARPGVTRTVRILAGFSYLLGFVHVYFIANFLAALAIESGWGA